MESVEEILSLHGGISQQDVSLRLNQQVEDSVNCYHTIESGTRRRNPTVQIGTATGTDSDCWTYSYDRGLASVLNEKYTIIYDEDGLRALDLNTGLTVSVTDNSNGYLEPYTGETGYSAVTVKDTTFITNRNKTTAMNSNVTSDVGNTAYIWIQRSEPVDGYDYTVTIKSNLPDVTVTSTGKLSTSAVATDLKTKIDSQGDFTATISNNNIISVNPSVGTTIITSIEVSDSYGNLASSGLFKEVATENDLPAAMPIDTIFQIGYGTSKYYLKYNGSQWTETLGFGLEYELDSSTMPHRLTREVDENDNVYFLFEPIDWNERLVGDDDSNALPKFVGTSITDIFFDQNRLGLLNPFGLSYSEVGSYYNFFRTTQVSILESDRIDVELSAKKAIRLHYAEFLENDLIIFGDKTQFRVSYNGLLSATTLKASIISSYDYNFRVRPLSLDNKIFFVALNNDYNAMFVYTKDDITNSNKADKVTNQVPYLLDKDVSQIVGSSVNSVLFLRSDTETDVVYVYKYLEDGGKLIQSAWFKWRFTSDIHSLFCTEGRLYLLATRENVDNDLYVDWIMYDSNWNDDNLWQDDAYWNDNTGVSTFDSLESIDIIPNPVSDTYLDNGSVSYTSSITLSEYLPESSNVKMISNKINLKTIYVKSSNDSIFELEITNIPRNQSRTITQEYVIGRKPYIMGKAKDTRISITSNKEQGFEINGVAIEARINNRSKKI